MIRVHHLLTQITEGKASVVRVGNIKDDSALQNFAEGMKAIFFEQMANAKFYEMSADIIQFAMQPHVKNAMHQTREEDLYHLPHPVVWAEMPVASSSDRGTLGMLAIETPGKIALRAFLETFPPSSKDSIWVFPVNMVSVPIKNGEEPTMWHAQEYLKQKKTPELILNLGTSVLYLLEALLYMVTDPNTPKVEVEAPHKLNHARTKHGRAAIPANTFIKCEECPAWPQIQPMAS